MAGFHKIGQWSHMHHLVSLRTQGLEFLGREIRQGAIVAAAAAVKGIALVRLFVNRRNSEITPRAPTLRSFYISLFKTVCVEWCRTTYLAHSP